jgi:hypothetical protein
MRKIVVRSNGKSIKEIHLRPNEAIGEKATGEGPVALSSGVFFALPHIT